MRQRTHPLAPDRARDPTATTMSRRSFLATASAIAAGAAMSPFLWSKVVRGAASFPGIRFFPGLGIRGNDTTWSGDLLRGGLLQSVQCPTRGQVVRLRPALLVLAEKKFEWKNSWQTRPRPRCRTRRPRTQPGRTSAGISPTWWGTCLLPTAYNATSRSRVSCSPGPPRPHETPSLSG